MSEQDQVRVRASDTEREEVVSVLRGAIGEGRLTLDEGEERIAAAYATTYRDELPGLAADLPPADPPKRGPGRDRTRPGPRPAAPVAGLVLLAAVAGGIWAVSAGFAVWPVILFGFLALMVVKGSRHRHGHGHGYGHGCGRPTADR